MVSSGEVKHSVSDLKELQIKLRSKLVGENVLQGDTPISIHMNTMKEPGVNRDNILGSFQEYGVAAGRGTDQKLYVCHLFR